MNIKNITLLKKDLDNFLTLNTNILLFEDLKDISLIDKIKIIYDNNLKNLNIDLIKFIIYVLIQKQQNQKYIEYFKHILIIETF